VANGVFRRFTNRLLEPGVVSDERVRENRQMADLILNQASQPQPIQHPLQGAAQLMQALNAQILRQRANRGEEALKKQRAAELGQFLGNFDPQTASLIQNAPEGQVRNALMGAAAGQLIEPPEPDNPFAKINPKDFTPESVALFQQTNDFSVLRPATEAGGQTARQRRIAAETERLRRMGFERPEERATAVVDGIINIGRDTQTGSPQLEDRGTGRVIEIAVQRGERGEPPTVPVDQTLWELAPKATGPVATTKAGGSQVSGTFGGPISEETIRARQVFNTAQNNLIRAFSLNPRFPVAEQNRILSNINLEPRFFDSAELMRSRMQGIDQFLRNELTNIEHTIQLPGLDKNQRNAREQAAIDIRGFLNQLGVPEQAPATDAPEGVSQELWDVMTPEERALWQN